MIINEFFENNILSSDSKICLGNKRGTNENEIFQHEENDEIDNSPTSSTQCTTIKKGRPKLDEPREKSNHMHSRNSRDNMFRKVKSALCRHIINLLNTTASVNKINKFKEITFYNLAGGDSSNITRNHCKSFLKMNIEEFLIKMKKTEKYKDDGSNIDTVKKIKENPNYMKIFKPLFKVSLGDYYLHVFLNNSNIISPKYDKVFQEIQKEKKTFNYFLEQQGDDEHALLLKETAEYFVPHFSS